VLLDAEGKVLAKGDGVMGNPLASGLGVTGNPLTDEEKSDPESLTLSLISGSMGGVESMRYREAEGGEGNRR